MLIDWFTVGAQVLNFVILVWLMKRFLYKPILHAIDTREKLIATELADAAAKKAEAHKESDEFQHKTEALEQQRAALMTKATADATAERERLLADARKTADAASAKRRDALRAEATSLEGAIHRRAQHEVFAIARKALTDLATTSLEERIAAVFTRQLQHLDAPAKAGIAGAIKAASGAALVRSAFELSPEQRAVIQHAVNETFSADVHVQFEVAPDLVSGIELVAGGQKVGWTIASYLESLAAGVDDLLTKNVEAKAKSEAETKAKTKPKVEPKPDATPEAKADAKTDAKVDAAKPDAKADAKPQPKPAAKAS